MNRREVTFLALGLVFGAATVFAQGSATPAPLAPGDSR